MAIDVRTRYTNPEVSDVARTLLSTAQDVLYQTMPRLVYREVSGANSPIVPWSICLLLNSTAYLPQSDELAPGDIICLFSRTTCTVYPTGGTIRGSASLAIGTTAVHLIWDGVDWH